MPEQVHAWLPEYDGPDFEYVPDQPTLRNYTHGYWAVAFPDFEAAVRHHAVLYTRFGFEDPVEEAVKWAVRHDYRPPGYSPKQYDRSKIADIKAAHRIEDVAARLTELRGSGKTLTGKCPLHREVKGRAFVVWPEIQKWRCYGACATGGDVLDLAEKAGIQPG